VIRMQHTLLGEAGFQAGLAEYFKRHDGAAVTCDDFVSAMESVYAQQHPGKNFDIFRRWYAQAGTPRVQVSLSYQPEDQSCTITLRQHNPLAGVETLNNPPQPKPPLHIPFAMGLLGQDGKALPITHEGKSCNTIVLELCQEEQSWHFTHISEQPVPS